MPRGKPVILSNGSEWSTRQAAEDYFRDLRDRYPLETVIDEPQDHDDLCALLERYDAAIYDGPSKIGCGVSHFVTRQNEVHGGKSVGFWVIRSDGTETDFSFPTAVAGRSKDRDAGFVVACRESVYEIISLAKKNHFAAFGNQSGHVRCEVTGEFVSAFDAKLDYAPTSFGDIVWEFRKVEGWEAAMPPGIVSPSADAQLSTIFTDIDVLARFRVFHAFRCQMRIVAKSLKPTQLLATRSNPVRQPVRLP
ncbi:DCL family protein [Rhizobium laguerreae]|uniref:DCL family protein n=1 Tax=Rhizobium laguerreae TaxID=1076926 RepID=UPI001C8FB307|nr:DCL family protein [Rhizobium laguerreae]MBY3382401.1 DCL family protein [Rhizobium laguerreae]